MIDLLDRDKFRKSIFARDGGLCIVCRGQGKQVPAVDAHHIIERRLWPDSGYYLDNGASVCAEHHLEAEATLISCDELRKLAGIEKILLPDHFYDDQPVDKWGNPILENGMRLRGELFDDPSVQKILAPVLNLFTSRVRYPRTYHLPWSPGLTNDDRMMPKPERFFAGKEVVVTAKMDGENTSFYNDYLHARSVDYAPHPSRNRVRALHGRIAHDIPENWRLCGENLYAKHSIHYQHLADYFLLFSVWNAKNVCIDWNETVMWAELLGLKTVPVLYRGIWDEEKIRDLYQSTLNGDPCEGYVVRLVDEFPYRKFRESVAKYVRAGHVIQHGGHWANRVIVPNELEKSATCPCGGDDYCTNPSCDWP